MSPRLRREVQLALETRREEIYVQHAVWFCLPWYVRAWRTMTFQRPEAWV